MATTSTPKAKASLPASITSSSASSTSAAPSSAASIVSKPARGWLHPDYLFAKDGINYNVRVSCKISYPLLIIDGAKIAFL